VRVAAAARVPSFPSCGSAALVPHKDGKEKADVDRAVAPAFVKLACDLVCFRVRKVPAHDLEQKLGERGAADSAAAVLVLLPEQLFDVATVTARQRIHDFGDAAIVVSLILAGSSKKLKLF
jgi:hypothetical protein